LQVAGSVRKAGVRVEVDVTGHGVSAGLRQAEKKHIQFALLVGDNEQQANVVTVRDLTTRQERVLDIQSLLCYIAGEEQHA
jgi:histidyl-tRNA synthetase